MGELVSGTRTWFEGCSAKKEYSIFLNKVENSSCRQIQQMPAAFNWKQMNVMKKCIFLSR